MGYCAFANGTFTVTGLTENKVSRMLNELKDEISELMIENCTSDGDKTAIVISYSSSHFDGDYLVSSLENIFGEYTLEGEINCESHEDTSVWRYIFDADDGVWNEECAQMVYDLKGFSDDELINELNERGYTVMREAKLRDIIG